MEAKEPAKNSENLSAEDELRRLAVELRLLEGTAETFQSRLNLLNAAWAELNIARQTLEGLEKEQPDVPIFVPVGGGSYAKAKITDVNNVIYGVGAGVAIEKTIKEAKEGIEKRLSEIEKSRQSLEQQLSQVLRRIQEDQDRFQDLSASLRKREKS